jgi:AcrR family transcriptional regulator
MRIMPRHKEAERDEVMSETRRSLLEAATEEFAREGYDGANINRMSKAAGFAKGTIYNYFPSKRALMLTLIDTIAAAHLGFVAERVRQEEDPIRRLQRFFGAGFEWITLNLCQGKVMLTTLNGPDVEFKARMHQAYQPMNELVGSDILAVGMECGVFRHMDLGSTAALLMTLYLGIGSTVDDQGKSRLTSEQIAEFVLHALRT